MYLCVYVCVLCIGVLYVNVCRECLIYVVCMPVLCVTCFVHVMCKVCVYVHFVCGWHMCKCVDTQSVVCLQCMFVYDACIMCIVLYDHVCAYVLHMCAACVCVYGIHMVYFHM